MKKRMRFLIAAVVAGALLAGVSGGTAYLITAGLKNQEIKDLKNQIGALKNDIASEAAAKVAPDKPQKEEINPAEYEGWDTFTDDVIGYSLRYPPGWTYEINDGEFDGKAFRYVAFMGPANEYYVTFGLRKKGTDLTLTERTGLGAGDFENFGSITVLGEKVTRVKHVYKGKVKAVFYPSASGYFTAGDFEGFGEFSITAPATYDTYNLQDTPESALADKILKSLVIISL